MTVLLIGFVILVALFVCIEKLTRRLFSFLESEGRAAGWDEAAGNASTKN